MSNGEAAGGEGQQQQAAQAPTDLGGATGETPAELESRAKELQATPGYIDGTLRNSNPERYKKLQVEITDLFNRSGEAAIPTLAAASEASMAQAETATALINEANKELTALKSMGFEQDRLPDEIMPHHLWGWRAQRLTEAQDYATLQPLLEQGLTDIGSPTNHAAALKMFLDVGDDFAPELRKNIMEQIVEHIFIKKHSAAKAKGGTL